MELTWHGHSTWHVSVNGTDCVIDPFFDNPKTDLDPETLDDPDCVLLTHGHADHIADVSAFPSSTVVATPELASYVEAEHGIGDTIGMNLGGTIEMDGVYVTMHRADHTNGFETGYEVSGDMPAGYLISDSEPGLESAEESSTFYHAGDTSLMSEMRDVIGNYLEPDIAAVPIGDHFTMGPEQAAIAVDWLDVDHALPMHYDSFPPIEQDPEEFSRNVESTGSSAEVHILEGDESITL